MVVVVTASFAQDAVFFSGEKLKCQFRFTNPASNNKSNSLSPTRTTSPDKISSERFTNNSYDANSTLSTLLDEGNSICSSRSSSESFNRVSAYGFKPSPVSKITIQNSWNKDHPTPPVHRNITPNIPNSRTNGLSHQPSLSQPIVQSKDAKGNGILGRHYRPSSVSSWFSPFTSSPNLSDVLKKNTAVLQSPTTKEKLLWGFVQLVGHFAVDENLVQVGPFEPLKEKKMYRAANGLGYGGSLGGGTIGQNHSPYASSNSKVSSLADLKKQGESRLFPVYSTPPSVIFCDVSLGPGDSIVYDYEITLPSNIPSSHRGKSVKFLYYLILGTQRGEITHEPNVVQLPFRLFSRFNEQGKTPDYNMAEPVLIYNDTATIKSPNDHAIKKKPSKTGLSPEEFLSKAMDTLSLQLVPSDEEETDTSESSSMSAGPLETSSCMRAVYGITRRVKPVSYSFNKEDIVIGRLCLRRSYYRVGETIPILIHFLPSDIKCYQVSVTLESFEQVSEGHACQTSSRTDLLTRQILAQFHTLATNADRLSIDLAIPNHCTPGFSSSAVSLQHRLRLEFLVAEKTLQNVVTTSIDLHRTHNYVQLPPGVEPEKLVCLAPIYLLPTHHSYAKMYRNFHSFELN